MIILKSHIKFEYTVRPYLYKIIPDLRLMVWFKSSSLYNYIANGNCDVSLWYIREMVYEDISSYCGMVAFSSYSLDVEEEIFMKFAEPQRIQKGLEKYNHSCDYLFWLLDKFSKQELVEHAILVERELGKRNAENKMPVIKERFEL